jgi:hypothetical protein
MIAGGLTKAKIDNYCTKNENDRTKFCSDRAGGGGGSTTPTVPRPNPPTPSTPQTPSVPPQTPAATGTFSIDVTIGDKTKAVTIKSADTLAEIMKQATKDSDLKKEVGFLGLGFYLFGLLKNFTLTVDGEEVDEPEEDDTASELGIKAGSKVEFEIGNMLLYGLSASCSLCCCAIIGLIVYFMFMQGDGY